MGALRKKLEKKLMKTGYFDSDGNWNDVPPQGREESLSKGGDLAHVLNWVMDIPEDADLNTELHDIIIWKFNLDYGDLPADENTPEYYRYAVIWRTIEKTIKKQR